MQLEVQRQWASIWPNQIYSQCSWHIALNRSTLVEQTHPDTYHTAGPLCWDQHMCSHSTLRCCKGEVYMEGYYCNSGRQKTNSVQQHWSIDIIGFVSNNIYDWSLLCLKLSWSRSAVLRFAWGACHPSTPCQDCHQRCSGWMNGNTMEGSNWMDCSNHWSDSHTFSLEDDLKEECVERNCSSVLPQNPSSADLVH